MGTEKYEIIENNNIPNKTGWMVVPKGEVVAAYVYWDRKDAETELDRLMKTETKKYKITWTETVSYEAVIQTTDANAAREAILGGYVQGEAGASEFDGITAIEEVADDVPLTD